MREPRQFRLSARNHLTVVVGVVVVSAPICVGENANVWQQSRTNSSFKMAVMHRQLTCKQGNYFNMFFFKCE